MRERARRRRCGQSCAREHPRRRSTATSACSQARPRNRSNHFPPPPVMPRMLGCALGAAPSRAPSHRSAHAEPTDPAVLDAHSRSALAITFLSCVENTNVVWNDRLISFISSRIPAPVLLSRFAVGSSARMIFGLRRERPRDRDALALSAAQLRSADGARTSPSCTTSRNLRDALRGARRGSSSWNCSSGYSTFSSAESTGKQVERLEDEADGPRAQIGELVGRVARRVVAVDEDAPASSACRCSRSG